MGRPRNRTRLGPKFSEGARMLWRMVAERYEGSQARCADALGIDPGRFSRLIYGDRSIGIDEAIRLRDEHGIDAAVWTRPPVEPFDVPPAEGAK